jgi:hyperosmotically inducible protein
MASQTEQTMTGSSVGRISWLGWVARDLALFAVLGGVGLASPWSRPSEPDPRSPQVSRPNNSPASASADEPAQSTKDREVARKIRRAVVTDKSLSIRAHNIKIIAKNGMVTLKGVVRSEQEKSAITARAIEIAGANNVKDEITVKPRS